jgi:diguanylate cyclase (GGDEF)-like protein
VGPPARRRGGPLPPLRLACLLVAIDLDELKLVNDSAGHAAGDRLLRRAAEAIGSAKRAADVVARLGGDEFGVLAVECDHHAAAVLAERLRGALAAAGVRASVGHATRRASADPAQAWAEADASMYASKRRR